MIIVLVQVTIRKPNLHSSPNSGTSVAVIYNIHRVQYLMQLSIVEARVDFFPPGKNIDCNQKFSFNVNVDNFDDTVSWCRHLHLQ